MSDITIAAPRHAIRGYLQAPPGSGRWPGVVVLHDIVGQTNDSRRYVDWFAASGYLAIAPDLYSWGSKLICIRATFRDLFVRQGATFEDIEAVRSFLAHRDDCTGHVGVIGFCMGGGFALILASGHGFSASAVNYGMVPKDVESMLRGACPVIGSFGAKDFTLKGAAAQLEAALQANGVSHDVKEYPEVGHAFMNKHSGVSGWVATRIGMRFDEASTADAQARILKFFERHLN